MNAGRGVPGARLTAASKRPVIGSPDSVVVGTPAALAVMVAFPSERTKKSTSEPAAVRAKLVRSIVSAVASTPLNTFPVTEKTLVWSVLTPEPPTLGPSMRTKLVPNGLPVIVWLVAGTPINPAGGAGAVASHARNGPALVVGSTLEKLHAGGTRPQPWSSVKLIVPVADATKVLTPNG